MSSTKENNNDASEKKGRSAALKLFENVSHFDPVQFVADIWDAFDMWRGTRQWRPIVLMIPGIILLFSVFGTVTLGMWTPNHDKLRKYAKQAEIVAPIKLDGLAVDRNVKKKLPGTVGKIGENGFASEDEGTEQTEEQKKALAEEGAKNSEFADLLFRRVLQLDKTNKNARYFVANQQYFRGNVEEARSTMESLAPADATAFVPAHAWKARDMLQQHFAGSGIKVDMAELNHHLSVSADWQGTDPMVLSIYAQKLESENKANTAINIMKKAAERDSAYFLPLSAMLARHSQAVQAKEAADRAISFHSESFGKKEETDKDRIAVAQVYVQSKKFDEAIKVLQEGLRVREDRPAIRRALSEVYRMLYTSSRTQTDSGYQVSLGLLNRALEADPTNPGVGEDIAWLQTVGVTADEKMIQSLREQLSAGTANAITHLLLGNAFMNKGNIKNAMVHWTLAMGQDPNLVIAMNNLAIGHSMMEPPEFDEALKIIDRAIELSRGEAEFHDSKGEILGRAGRHTEAIIEYEKAIQKNPMRIETREKLVKCYEMVDMKDLADAQMSVIAKIRAQYKAAGLNENGKGGMKPTPPPKAQVEKTEAPKSVLPDTLFEGIPSQTDNPATKTDASKPQ